MINNISLFKKIKFATSFYEYIFYFENRHDWVHMSKMLNQCIKKKKKFYVCYPMQVIKNRWNIIVMNL